MRKRDAPPPDPGDDDAAALFRDAVGPVRPVAATAPLPQRPRPKPAARMAQRDEEAARNELREMLLSGLEAGDALSYRREDVPAAVLRRLARGDYAAQEELDLHGLPMQAAEGLLREFLRDCRRHGAGCVRIVHGKGRNSGDRLPVLKNLVDRMLRQRADTLAFHSAPAAQGGLGAVLVLLRRD